MAQALEVGLDGLGEAHPVAAVGETLDRLGLEPVGEADPGAGAHLPPGPRQDLPLAGLLGGLAAVLAAAGGRGARAGLDQQKLHPAAGLARLEESPAVEARRDHPRVVDHQKVSRPEQLGQVGHLAVAGLAAGVEHQEPALAARGRLLGDPVLGEAEVEVAGQHGCPLPSSFLAAESLRTHEAAELCLGRPNRAPGTERCFRSMALPSTTMVLGPSSVSAGRTGRGAPDGAC